MSKKSKDRLRDPVTYTAGSRNLSFDVLDISVAVRWPSQWPLTSLQKSIFAFRFFHGHWTRREKATKRQRTDATDACICLGSRCSPQKTLQERWTFRHFLFFFKRTSENKSERKFENQTASICRGRCRNHCRCC